MKKKNIVYDIARIYSLSVMGEYRQVVKTIDNLLKLDNHSQKYLFELYSAKGNAFIALQEYNNALKEFNRAMELNSHSSIYFHKARCLFLLDEYEEGLMVIDNGLTLFKDTSLHLMKGLILCFLKRYQEVFNILNNQVIYDNISYKNFRIIFTLYQNALLKDNLKIYELDLLEKNIQKYISKIFQVYNNDEFQQTSYYQYSLLNKNTIYNIRNQQIYFSDPMYFNDPFDPLIKIFDPIDNKKNISRMMELLNIRISCLTKDYQNILMWSHYADKHKGICIEYDIEYLLRENTNILFKKIKFLNQMSFEELKFNINLTNKPFYLKELNSILDKKIQKDPTIIDTYVYKYEQWEYEKESRLILHKEENTEVLYHCPIKEIYLGKDMLREDVEFIKQLVQDINSKQSYQIKLSQMKISDHNVFELNPEEIKLSKFEDSSNP